ncbi:MAG TPA: histidine kinase [Mucilaginibacter sp.]
MKSKLFRHLIFWLVYNIQGTLLEYEWISYPLAKFDQGHIIRLAIYFNLALLPSKLLFTYFASHVFANQGLKMHYKIAVMALELIVAMLFAIVLYRIPVIFYINSYVEPNTVASISRLKDIGWDFVALLDIGYVAGIAIALKLFRMQVVTIKNEKNLIKDKLETELKFLKNQINPHFLFNTLNNIYALARKKSDKTPEVVVRLSKLLRFMLYESAKHIIPISEEIRILEDYVELEKIRHNKKLNIAICKEIDNYDQLIAPLILLPFIENAFKHGVNETLDETSIEIRIKLHEGQLDFYVKNGHEHEVINPVNEKIGLSNVRRQLELMYKDFSLTARNLAQTFTVDLRINLYSNGKI